jgi:hypothetical protein
MVVRSLPLSVRFYLYSLYIEQHVKPKYGHTGRKWWIHERPRPELRVALSTLSRYIVTPHVSKHRLFVWLKGEIVPDHQLIVVARDDDYFFGVLHARPHELWALRMGTSLEDRPRYTPTSTFGTYPFPWPPGKEDQSDPKVQTIAEAARELVRLRDEWLAGDDERPKTNDERDPAHPSSVVSRRSSSDRTLTNLYNRRPDWLAEAHRRLDAAVFDAYGWPPGLSDDEILARLLALNLERAAVQAAGTVEQADDEE